MEQVLQACLGTLQLDPSAAGSIFVAARSRCVLLEKLRVDATMTILAFLDLPSLANMGLTCWALRRVILRADYVWRTLAEAYLPLWFESMRFRQKPAVNEGQSVWRALYFDRMRADLQWRDQPAQRVLMKRFPRGIHSLYFDRDSLLLGSGQWNEVLSFDLKTGRNHAGANGAGMFGHTAAVTALKPLPNNMLMTSSLDTTLRLFDRSTMQMQKVFAGHTDKIWCVDVYENRVFSGSSDKTIRVWDLESTEAACEPLRSHRTSISAIKVVTTLPAPLLFTGSAGNTIRVWDIAGGSPRCTEKLRGHTKGVFCLQSTPSVLMSGSLDNVIKAWDPRQGFRLVYDLRMKDENGNDLIAYTEDSEQNNIGVIAFQCDDTKVVAGGPDRMVRIWDLRMRRIVNELGGHSHWITTLQFDENKIVTGSRDKTVRFWDMSGKLLDEVSADFEDPPQPDGVQLPPANVQLGANQQLPPLAPQGPGA